MGTGYQGVDMSAADKDGVALIYDKLWIGQGYTNPDLDPAALRVVGFPGVADKALFLPGTGGTLNVGIGAANPATGFEFRNGTAAVWNNVTAGTWSGSLAPASALALTNSANGCNDPVLLYRQATSTGVIKTAGAIGFTGTGNWTNGAVNTQISDMYFVSRDNNDALAERMRITSTGNVGIGTAAPAASAAVEMASTTRGFLPPRMTTAQRQAINAPAAGLMVYDTTAGTLMFYNGAQWQTVGGASVPIGTIMAWHKSLAGTPALPEGWVECNGQVLNDAGSPYNGQTMPDLNNTPSGGYTGGGRFLRGGTVSGVMQGATHAMTMTTHGGGAPYMYLPSSAAGAPGTDADASFPPIGTFMTFGALNYVNGWTGGGYGSRPVNMSVVWIMRVK